MKIYVPRETEVLVNDKYAAMARAIWQPEAFNVPNDVYMARIARALERAALEGAIEALNNVRTNSTAIGVKVTHLRARLAELDVSKGPRKEVERNS